jgi:hypothetical protein
MEREIRAWWNDLRRTEQDAWIAAWRSGMIGPEAAVSLPLEWFHVWTTGDPLQPAPQLADFLEQQAATRFLRP